MNQLLDPRGCRFLRLAHRRIRNVFPRLPCSQALCIGVPCPRQNRRAQAESKGRIVRVHKLQDRFRSRLRCAKRWFSRDVGIKFLLSVCRLLSAGCMVDRRIANCLPLPSSPDRFVLLLTLSITSMGALSSKDEAVHRKRARYHLRLRSLAHKQRNAHSDLSLAGISR